MVPIKRADRTTQIADMVMKTEAALGELHHYHRFGRHLSVFPQKPYFLFSHCAHLLFSLWLDEQDSPTKVFGGSPSLAVLFSKVDFGALRYADYSRRVLYANAYEEHLKNEPKWFKFWIRLLQELQGADAAGFEEFSRQFFACLADDSVLEGKLARRDQKTLANLVQGPRAGRLLLHSIWVLEDVISTIGSYLARLDPACNAIEQMQAMICLLSQFRRTIVWETAAKGPYTLPCGLGWDTPSTFDRLLGRKSSGLLTVTPGHDGGELTCTYTWDVDSKADERTWTRSIAALPCAYEELLFKTWPQETREQPRDSEAPAQAQARWIVHAVEAGHLEAISREVDKLIEGFGKYPAYSGFVETVAHILRNGQSEWTCTELPWDYVRRLDQLIGKLKFACREAKVLGGERPAEKVVPNLWPPHSMPARETAQAAPESPASQNPATQELPAPATNEPQRTENETDPIAPDNQAAPVEIPPTRQTPCRVEEAPVADALVIEESCSLEQPMEEEITESSQEPEPMSIESVLMPACLAATRDRAGSPAPSERGVRSGDTDNLTQVISLLIGEDTRPPQAEPRAETPGGAEDASVQSALQCLIWRLREWHRPAAEGNDREPLALVQLQHDLGWNQSKVLEVMGMLFGSKPFTLYRQKCLGKSIRRFLEDIRIGRKDGSQSNAPTLCSSTA